MSGSKFSSRCSFASHIGVGYLFGGDLKIEVSLRSKHHPNTAIKEPDPGENCVRLRHARRC
ncbi:acyloxyacyl hydrolase [Diaphorobacter caeni]|uniref:acyloxyacyl hydrolase n=1 Tax=Diaphorobacter caeni TaxID=2784387 RepID=UPI00188E1799|nr:acyloxyacyl hydrolase [Diaphorobacter caeni]